MRGMAFSLRLFMNPQPPKPSLPSTDEIMVRDALWLKRLGRRDEGANRHQRLMASAQRVNQRRSSLPRIQYPEDLPVSARAAELIELIKGNPVIVVAGETGSGKTTQLPKICLEAGFGGRGMIGCTQPRRVAALSVSRRIAEELGVEWGREVGAKIRFTDRTGPQTLIKMLTDGMLLSEIQGDPLLSDYEVIIVDEAHERSLNIDFLLGYLVQLREKRPDLRIIITSATIDTASFAKAFGGAPIVEVTGRTYPVDVVYAPVDEMLEDPGEISYTEAAARAVEEVVLEDEPGDILVFLPTERDIRDCRELLEDRIGERTELIMLFGRLSSAEQERIFKPVRRRKVILSTNIAETSLTIPGIRTVVDTGLARISRYNPNAHTQRLPIEPIAQSSAEQRRGRAGRLGPGLCIRLYDEQDFAARPVYTTPEIQRANLAAVILRMVSLRLGDVEAFPFIDPPRPQSVRAGYQLLRDLGALDEQNSLTPIGRQLARLPCDPTIGRMLIQGQREGSLRETLIIAAGLSIQDPRERPVDQTDAADQMHRRFVSQESDFLTLLNIWNAVHAQTERLTQARMRRFCREHFLAYMRMREWLDIHDQLMRVLEGSSEFRLNEEAAEYHQIHRALLSGLLMNIAERVEGNHYKGCRNRSAMLFPGSGLFDKRARKAAKEKGRDKKGEKPRRMPAWVFCAEWVETGRLYLRTAARIELRWVLDLGAHLLQSSFSEPFYDEKGERVLVKERRRLYGLEVDIRTVGYGRIHPKDATEIFVREALIEGRMESRFPFRDHNERVKRRVRDMQTRLRQAGTFALEQRLFGFYMSRLHAVASAADLHAFINKDGDEALRLTEADLIEGGRDATAAELFPDAIDLGGTCVSLDYQYEPGAEHDGATLRVPIAQVGSIDPSVLEWAVPGYVRQRIDALLRALPKEIRRGLFPIGDRVEALTRLVRPSVEPLHRVLGRLIQERYGVSVPESAWDLQNVPEHLRPRVEVVDARGRPVVAGRDWQAVHDQYEQVIREQVSKGEGTETLSVWKKACAEYERTGIDENNLPELPERILAGDIADMPIYAYPGLRLEKEGLAVCLSPNLEQALQESRPAFRVLLERAFGRDLAWLERDLTKTLKLVALVAVGVSSKAGLAADARRHMVNHFFEGVSPLPLSPKRLVQGVEQAKERSQGWIPRFVDLLELLLKRRLELANAKDPLADAMVQRLFPVGFLAGVPHRWLVHYPRYLKAHDRRVQRARLDPRKDAERARELVPFEKQIGVLPPAIVAAHDLFWLLEELRVSVFAQDLGTALKVSPARLQAAIDEVRHRSEGKTA